MAKSLREARGSLMADIETLNDLLHSLGEGWERGQGSTTVLGDSRQSPQCGTAEIDKLLH